MADQYSRDGSLLITRPMINACKSGLGHCLRLRSMLDDADAIGIPHPVIRQQLDDYQAKFEGMVAYNAAKDGVNSNG